MQIKHLKSERHCILLNLSVESEYAADAEELRALSARMGDVIDQLVNPSCDSKWWCEKLDRLGNRQFRVPAVLQQNARSLKLIFMTRFVHRIGVLQVEIRIELLIDSLYSTLKARLQGFISSYM